MIHNATPGYEDESTNFMLVINYVVSALGCVIFATMFGFFSSGDMLTLNAAALRDGFIPTMWFSIAILGITLLCTLSVKNKIVKA